jgi:hypothetical protein
MAAVEVAAVAIAGTRIEQVDPKQEEAHHRRNEDQERSRAASQ